MADAVLYLVEHPDKVQSMGEAGRAYIMKHYRRDVVFMKWNQVLSQLGAESVLSATHGGEWKSEISTPAGFK